MGSKLQQLGRAEGEGQLRSGSRQAQVGFNLVFHEPSVRGIALLWGALLSAAWVGFFYLERSGDSSIRPADRFWGYVAWALVALAISLFFSLATAHATDAAIDGRPSMREALRSTVAELPALAGWYCLLAGAWVAIGFGLGRVDPDLRLLAWVVTSLALTIATFFVIPALALERQGPLTTLRESLGPLRQRWRAALAGVIGLGILIFALSIPGTMLARAASDSYRLGHDSWKPQLLAGACLLMLAFAIGFAAREGFALILYRDARDDLPGAPAPAPARETRRGWKIAGTVVAVLLGIFVLQRIVGHDRDTASAGASTEAAALDAGITGGPETTVAVLSDPKAILLTRGAPVIDGKRRIGSVVESRLEDLDDADSPVLVVIHVNRAATSLLAGSRFSVAERGGSTYLVAY